MVLSIFTAFMCEGSKILLRFQYSILKVNKEGLKTIDATDNFKTKFSEISNSKTDWYELSERAYAYKITRNEYNFETSQEAHVWEIKSIDIIDSVLPDGTPNPSEILKLDELQRLWVKLPHIYWIRTPELLYNSS